MENVNKASTSIKNWALDDRPREKMLAKGLSALSNAELLAILIQTGHKNKSAVELAKSLLQFGQNNLNEMGKLTLAELKQVKGIGTAKAISIMAALELGRRRNSEGLLDKQVIRSSNELARFLREKLKDQQQEVFCVLFLNQANKVNHFEIVSLGGITGTVADPRVIFKKALEHKATSLVLCHNHPSGSLRPSRADEELTQKIKQAAALLDIRMLDHLIVSEEGYFSFADEGLL